MPNRIARIYFVVYFFAKFPKKKNCRKIITKIYFIFFISKKIKFVLKKF